MSDPDKQAAHPSSSSLGLGCSPLGQAGRDNTDLYNLIATYTPPNYLRTKHRQLIKKIYSLQQGFDGTKAFCCICGKIGEVEDMDVHHYNHIVGDNRLANIGPAHGKCNDAENGRSKQAYVDRSCAYPRQGEGENQEQAATRTATQAQLSSLSFSNKEGAKHEVMRPSYDNWIRDAVNGPFAKTYRIAKLQLSEAAPYACSKQKGKALGSSKTYLKYINEDIQGKILIEETEYGVSSVSLNKDLLAKIQQETGQ